MSWTVHSSLDTTLRDAHNRLTRQKRYERSVQTSVSGTAQIAAAATLTLFGGGGGILDSAFSLIRYIRIDVSGGQLDVRASRTTAQTNSMRIDDEGLYFVPSGEADHVVLENPSSTDPVTVTFFLGGDL